MSPPDDPYDMDMRLCDDEGIVSHKKVEDPGTPWETEQTYITRLNHLKSLNNNPDIRGPYEGEPFSCTGHAHHGGCHIRCTSPAHQAKYYVPQPGTANPLTCGHTFAYWSVVPPTHCYLCGAQLPQANYPRPVWQVDTAPHHLWDPSKAPVHGH